jgi:hypothetical protein
MFKVSLVDMQVPLETVQTNWFNPGVNPFIAVDAEVGLSIKPDPTKTLQKPDPTDGATADKIAEVAQVCKSDPANASDGGLVLVMVN